MDRKLRIDGRTYWNTMWPGITSSPIYGKAGQTLLFEAYFLEPKKYQNGGIYSSDHISWFTSATLRYDL